MPLSRVRTAAVAVVVVLGVAAGAAALGPWLIGLHVERLYAEALTGLEARGFRILANDYRRGWLGAEAETLIAPRQGSVASTPPPSLDDPATALRLRVRSRIDHGPRGARWTTWPPVLAEAHSRSILAGESRRLPPLILDAELRPGAQLAMRLRLPDLTYSGGAGQLHLMAVHGALHMDVAGSRFWGTGQAGALEAIDADGRALALRDLGWRLDLTEGAGLPVGELVLTLRHAALTDPSTAEDEAAVDDGLPPFDAGGLRLTLTTRLHQDRFGLTMMLALDRLLIREMGFAPSRIGLAVSGLHAPALAGLTRVGSHPAAPALAGSPPVMGAIGLLGHLPQLLALGPSASVAPLSLATPDGAVTAEVTLSLPPRAADAAAGSPVDLGSLIDRLHGQARLELPRALLLKWLTAQQRRRAEQELARLGERPAPFPAHLVAQVADAGEAALDGLIRARWLVPVGAAPSERLKAVLVIGDGLLTVNGRSLPVAVMLGS
jgi:hypothetical protein